jgi:hypothetical protein
MLSQGCSLGRVSEWLPERKCAVLINASCHVLSLGPPVHDPREQVMQPTSQHAQLVLHYLLVRHSWPELHCLASNIAHPCMPGTLFQSQVPLGFSRDPTTGTCSPWPLLPFHTSAPLVRGLVISLTQGERQTCGAYG